MEVKPVVSDVVCAFTRHADQPDVLLAITQSYCDDLDLTLFKPFFEAWTRTFKVDTRIAPVSRADHIAHMRTHGFERVASVQQLRQFLIYHFQELVEDWHDDHTRVAMDDLEAFAVPLLDKWIACLLARDLLEQMSHFPLKLLLGSPMDPLPLIGGADSVIDSMTDDSNLDEWLHRIDYHTGRPRFHYEDNIELYEHMHMCYWTKVWQRRQAAIQADEDVLIAKGEATIEEFQVYRTHVQHANAEALNDYHHREQDLAGHPAFEAVQRHCYILRQQQDE